MPNFITFNTSGLIAGIPLTGENYYKFSSGTGVLATAGSWWFSINLTADSDNNPATFNLRWNLYNDAGLIKETYTGVMTFLDTDIFRPGPESWTADLNYTYTIPLLPDSNHDGLPDGFVFIDSSNNFSLNIPFVWQAKDSNNVLATFSATIGSTLLSGSLKDTNNDNLPDHVLASQGTQITDAPISMVDNNGDGVLEQLQVLEYFGTRIGRVQVDGSGNPAGLLMDPYSPHISAYNPAGMATDVAVDRNIIITFDEPIQKGTGLITIHSDSATGPIVESYDITTSTNLSISGNTLTINPSSNFDYGTHYVVLLPGRIVNDFSGNNYYIADNAIYDFTTVSPTHTTMLRNGISVIPEYYTGPATAAGGAPIRFQFIGDSTGEVVIGTTYNDFINVAGGVDAVNAGAGNDVIDGGTDSNFLTGGAGTDIFFSDGRGGVTTWSTITDWQAGEQLSVWGWHPGTSKIIAWVQAGAAGYEGLTMHADLNGDGTIDTSVTFTGIVSQSQLPAPLEFDGVLWFV
jgi:hypothetical protein